MTYPELQEQIWMLRKKAASMTIGISMDQEICLILGQVSISLILSEKPPDGSLWSGERLTKRQATSRPDHLWPELWDEIGKKCPAEGEAKVVT